MKKIGKIKRIGLTATVFFLCLAMLITCFTFVKPFNMRAFAEEPSAPTEATTSAKIDLLAGLTLQDEVKYGEEINVPAASGVTVTVTAPNGDKTENAGGTKVVANQMGVYKITYGKDSVSYDFNVKVTLEDDYFLWVEYNGADIPTYLQKDKTFTVPVAKLMYYNDDNILTEYEGTDCAITVTDSLGKDYTLASDGKSYGTFKNPGSAQKVFLTYAAKLGNDGTKHYTKTFPINVQSKVNNGGNPSLSVSGVQKDASVNRPVTLPVAKATDTNDDNIKVVIEVYEPDGSTLVKNVKVDEDGYASETLASDVVFDNDKSMTFYPTKTGAYKVKYTAYNDYNAIDANSGKSGTNEFTITVADHVAPVFKKVDEHLIPETWGKVVTNKDGNASNQNKITFTVPEVVDNKDHAVKKDKDDTDLISVYFRITDSDNSRTILEVKNILDVPYVKGDDDKYPTTDNKGTSSDYEGDITFTADGFEFDFAKYKRKDKKGEEMKSNAGTYTVLYRARDKANNTSSKTYTITFKDEYEDKAEPNEAEVTAPEYLSAADEKFTVPYPVYSDANDTRPYVVYRLYTDADGVTPNYIDVEGGEEAEIKGGNVVIDDQTLKLGKNLYFYVYVEDKAGNYISNAKNQKPDAVTVADIAAVTKVIGATDGASKKYTYNGNIEFVNKEKAAVDAEKKHIAVGDTVSAGGFNIAVSDIDMRAYTGFEVAVTDPNGNPVAVTLETVSVPNAEKTAATIYVQNITFTASAPTTEDDKYTMAIRVFDVNGVTDVYGYSLDGVTAKSGNNNTTSATPVIGSTGSVKTKYKLNNEVIKGLPAGDYFVARKISGGTFSLMGSELVAMTEGSYSVQDGYIGYASANDGKGLEADGSYDFNTDVTFGGANEGVYNFSITDSATPVVELQGTMPTYKAKYDAEKEDGAYTETNGLVKLPKAVAYTENGMGVVEIEVKDPDSYDVDLDDDAVTHEKSFKATKDGVYTVTYTATYKNATPATATYSISVGDVFAPVFTTEGGTDTNGTKQEGDTFSFAKLVLVEEESNSGLTITKEIYDPSGEIMSGSTVSGSFSGYADKGNNGSEIKLNKVGDYKIVYTVKDAVGNEYKLTDKVTVASQGSSSPTTWTTLSTVLIIVAIVLLAGVIIYVVRFRKVKK